MNGMTDWLLLIAALGAGLNAGFFFAFSILVMPALGGVTPAEGMRVMQKINVVVLNPWFFSVFFGTALMSLALAALALSNAFALAGAIVFLVGAIGVTMVFNVPLNNQLEAANAESEVSAALWRRYLVVWTGWNHVRTIAPLAACALFILALAQPA